jgi:hypothetical protein
VPGHPADRTIFRPPIRQHTSLTADDGDVHDREAYRALFSIGGTLAALPEKNVSNLPAAVENARTFVAELTERLRAGLK